MTIREKIQIQAVEGLLNDIRSVLAEGGRSGNRSALADAYEMTLASGSYFPPKPLALRRSLPSELRKRVSRTCPSCIRPEKMFQYVQEAKTVLRSYSKDLEEWLKEREVDPGTPDEFISVHDLNPTIKKDDETNNIE